MGSEEQEQVAEITLTVPVNYELPHIFSIADPVAVAQLLTLGAQGYQLFYTEGTKLRNQNVFEELKAQAAAEWEPKMKETKGLLEHASEQINQLKRRLDSEAADRMSLEARIREEERRNRQDLLTEKDQQIVSLKQHGDEMLKQVVESMNRMREKYDKSTASSKVRGDIGEQYFAEFLTKTFGSGGRGETFSLEDTGKEGHKGDLHMEWRGSKSLWEVKNYTYTVPTPEVQKFLKDMETNPSMNFGVLVSLHSGIANHSKAGAIDISVLADGRFCIFISKFLAGEDPLHSLMSWKPFFEVFYELQKATGAEHTEALSKVEQETVLQQRIQKAEEHRQLIIRLFKHHEEETRALRTEFMNVKKSFDEGWVRLNAKLTIAEQSIAGIIKTVLAGPTAFAIVEQEDVDGGAAKKSRIELPTHIFTKPDIQLYTPQQREFIEAVLDHFEITTEEAIQLQKKQFKDTILTTAGLTEDMVQRFCETVLNDGCWCKGKQKVRYLKLRA
jgi:hypothetical protein